MARKLIQINGVNYVNQKWRGMDLEFYPAGNIKQGLLDDPTLIQGYPMCCEISFYPSGKLKCGRLNKKITIRDIEFYEYIYLYENGALRSSKLYSNTKINGINFMNAQYLDFDEKGNITAGCLAEEIKVDGLIVPERSFIRFDEKRKLHAVINTDKSLYEEPAKTGVSVNNFEICSWENGQFGGVGSSCSFRDFLQGTMNEVVEKYFPELFQKIYSMVEEKHNVISDIRPEIKLIL